MPYIIQRVEDIDAKKIPIEKSAIYASTKSIEVFKKKFSNRSGSTHVFVGGTKNVVFVVNEMKNKTVYAFSENYLLENLEHVKT
jgi:flagellar motor switch protein FliG